MAGEYGEHGRARDIVRQYLEWFSMEHGVRHTVELNLSWAMQPGSGKTIGMEHDDDSGKGSDCFSGL